MIVSWTRIEKFEGDMGRKPVAQCPLTARQQNALNCIIRYQKIHGRTPTIRELGELIGVKSEYGVVDYLNRLEAKGKIRRNNDPYRNIEVVGDEPDSVKYQALLQGLREELARLKRLDPDVLSEMIKREKADPEKATTSFVRIRQLLRGVK